MARPSSASGSSAPRSAERIAEQARRNAERRAAHDRAPGPRPRAARRSTARFARPRLRRGRSVDYGRAPSATPSMQVGTDADPCRNNNDRDDDYDQHCEVRDSTLPAGPLNVDAGQNGGISVEGVGSQRDSRPRHRPRLGARSDARARELAGQVQVQAGGGRVYATGPETRAPRVVVGQLPHQRAAQERSRSRAPATAASPSSASPATCASTPPTAA